MTDPARLTAELIRCPSVTPEEAGALTLLADGLIMVMIYRTCFTADDQYRPPEAR